uniref:DUF4220 domain-containing protein n=1 Tax=Oryza meridionalis TaxID=40149 RepID=A0A0E0EYG2_9ORYZ
MSFLNDFFNSRYAIIFAKGASQLSSMAVVVHRFCKFAKEDELGRDVHQGVYFTWAIIFLLGAKEIWEITTYAFSEWSKVLLLCKYVEQPWWLRGSMGSVARTLVRMPLWRRSLFKRWHGKVSQFNVFFSITRLGCLRVPFSVHLSQQVKCVMIDSLKSLLSETSTHQNYLERAIQAASATSISEEFVNSVLDDVHLQDDVHKLFLVWHIVTCYCEL